MIKVVIISFNHTWSIKLSCAYWLVMEMGEGISRCVNSSWPHLNSWRRPINKELAIVEKGV